MEKTYNLGSIPLDLSFCDKSDTSCKWHYSGHVILISAQAVNHTYGISASEWTVRSPENSGIAEHMTSVDLQWTQIIFLFFHKTWLIIKFYRKCKIVPRESMWKNSCIDVTPDITIFRPLQMYWFLIHFKHHF